MLFVLFLEWGLGVWVFCVCARVLCLGIFFVCCFGFFCGFLLLVGWLGGFSVTQVDKCSQIVLHKWGEEANTGKKLPFYMYPKFA